MENQMENEINENWGYMGVNRGCVVHGPQDHVEVYLGHSILIRSLQRLQHQYVGSCSGL